MSPELMEKTSRKQSKKELISKLIAEMSIEQKVGQCFVIGFCGTIITPEILRRIRNYYPSGIRAGLTFRSKTARHDPYATSREFADRVLRSPVRSVKDYVEDNTVPHCTNEEYCRFLNTMKQEALDNGLGVPLHVTMDMEGGVSCDYTRGGIYNFPMPMGLAKSGDPQQAYNAAWATARQLRSIGVNWLHSPVLGVNTEPLNPEISDRAYGETAQEVIKFATAAFEGYRDGGLITSGKHYPGRGASKEDAHAGLPYINLDKGQMQEHLKPFQALVDAGIPSIMTAHTVYPAYDDKEPSTLSKPLLIDLLRNEMGFEGTVTTDDITMGGIVQKYEVYEACRRSIMAGSDLILLRDESPLIDEVIEKLVDSAYKGDLPEERLDEAIARTLSVKYDYGLFENGNLADETKADEGFLDPRVAQIAKETAEASLKLMRDENEILPLSPDTKVILVEQRNPLHVRINSQKCHPGIFWEIMCKHSENVGIVETEMCYTDDDKARIENRLDEADVLVVTNYFDRREHNDTDYIEELHKKGKPVIVVTNSHYPLTVSDKFKTVINTYGVAPESLEAAAELIYGKK
ncbi:Beta-hexosaminidase A precursor [Limihaloglobus sulfuriphilus]|uniref:beta-N-acetylhexosaminidase n=1 Tax=Limihaloglobus sulfuriphilus TaxID=1851148 RepID=A0A1Q2MEF5_9BACT|nr:glycoside hydrolase family 3 protein [Limihaloglobus sulfuriphilus]AQQ71050.1 Beta-hexosaminidase A precursor [Limihaloglobus sulfuriphilus]